MTLKELTPWRWGGLRRMDDDAPQSSVRNEIDALHREMDRLFEDLWRDRARFPFMKEIGPVSEAWPTVDEAEDEKGYRITVDLPGMDQKDVEVTLGDGLLTIRGEKKQEQEEKHKDYYRKERSFGSFRRVLPVPGEVDENGIKASFNKGVLTVELPKTEEAQKKVKRIDIQAA